MLKAKEKKIIKIIYISAVIFVVAVLYDLIVYFCIKGLNPRNVSKYVLFRTYLQFAKIMWEEGGVAFLACPCILSVIVGGPCAIIEGNDNNGLHKVFNQHVRFALRKIARYRKDPLVDLDKSTELMKWYNKRNRFSDEPSDEVVDEYRALCKSVKLKKKEIKRKTRQLKKDNSSIEGLYSTYSKIDQQSLKNIDEMNRLMTLFENLGKDNRDLDQIKSCVKEHKAEKDELVRIQEEAGRISKLFDDVGNHEEANKLRSRFDVQEVGR